MPSNYVLDSHFKAFIRDLVESGRYRSARDVMEDGLHLLEDREKRLATRLSELRDQVEEGRASGVSEQDGEAFLDALQARYEAMAARRS